MFKELKTGQNKKMSTKMSSLILYTIFWLLCASIILLIFWSNGKSFLWKEDGIYQHYVSFRYLCDYLNDLICNFHFKGFFNFTLGQGMDILTTLNSYDFIDPISIVCALIFPLSRISRYTLMIFIKLYLIGISFLFFCHATERKDTIPITAGAIAYVFSGAILIMFARHPNFINWAYFFPFLLGGIELYFRKGKKWPLILFVFLNLITSYYTFYINAILVSLYVIVHSICKIIKVKKLTVFRDELIRCLKLAGVCCIGILLSSFILFPTIYAYLNNSRIAGTIGYTESMWHYNLDFYVNLFERLFVSAYHNFPQYTSNIGLNGVLIIPLLLIFTKWKDHAAIESLFVLSLIMACIPFIGSIINGFSYATNRWIFVIPFYASVILVAMFPYIKEMSNKEKVFVFSSIILYVILCVAHFETNKDGLKIPALIVILTITVILAIVLNSKSLKYEPILFALIIACACFQTYYTFSSNNGDLESEFLAKSNVTSSYKNYSSSVISDINDEDNFYRTEMLETQTNINEYNHYNGTGFWWSLVSADVMNYYTDLALDSVIQNCNVQNLDGRTGLLSLASVKYYTRPQEDDGLIPYGYNEIESPDRRYQIFENQYSLPIGYTYTNYISTEKYKNMNGIEKEQALLQGAVLDNAPENIEETTASFNYRVLDYEITRTNNVSLENNKLKIKKKNGSIHINTSIPKDSEIYVYINGIKLDKSSDELNIEVSREKEAFSVTKSTRISNENYNWPVLRDEVCFNLGYGYEGNNEITLTFNSKATLSYDNIQIIAVPMLTYVENVEKLDRYTLKNIVIGTDTVKGTISVPSSQILQLSIPYSDGWKAYVDGEKVNILKSDIMYMAIELSPGHHTIELRYHTPYLSVGVIISIITLIILIAYSIIHHFILKHRGVQSYG